MGDTIVARNRSRTRKYNVSIQELGDLEDQWSKTNQGETFDEWLDQAFGRAGAVDNLWKAMDKKEKAKYGSLEKFRKAVKLGEK